MIDQPNTTQTPNLIYSLMPEMGEAELRVTLAICRQTFGYGKYKDKISLSQLMSITGMSKQGVLGGIEVGLERGTIMREPAGNSYAYFLMVNEVDRNGQRRRPSGENGGQRGGPPGEKGVNEVDRQGVNEVDRLGQMVNDVDRNGQRGGPSEAEMVNDVDTQYVVVVDDDISSGSGDKKQQQHNNRPQELNEAQRAALEALLTLGVWRDPALEFARSKPKDALAWCHAIQFADKAQNPPAIVRSRLEAGDPPPQWALEGGEPPEARDNGRHDGPDRYSSGRYAEFVES